MPTGRTKKAATEKQWAAAQNSEEYMDAEEMVAMMSVKVPVAIASPQILELRLYCGISSPRSDCTHVARAEPPLGLGSLKLVVCISAACDALDRSVSHFCHPTQRATHAYAFAAFLSAGFACAIGCTRHER